MLPFETTGTVWVTFVLSEVGGGGHMQLCYWWWLACSESSRGSLQVSVRNSYALPEMNKAGLLFLYTRITFRQKARRYLWIRSLGASSALVLSFLSICGDVKNAPARTEVCQSLDTRRFKCSFLWTPVSLVEALLFGVWLQTQLKIIWHSRGPLENSCFL